MVNETIEEVLEHLLSVESVKYLKKSSSSLWVEYKNKKVKFYFCLVDRAVYAKSKYNAVTVKTLCDGKYVSTREMSGNIPEIINKILNFDFRKFLN